MSKKLTYEKLEAKLEKKIALIDSLKEEIQQKNSFLEMIFDAMPCPIFYKDYKGIYKNCNNAFSKNILGIEKKDIVGKSLYDFPDQIPKKHADIYIKQDNDLLNKTGMQFYSTDVKCSDNIIRHFNFYKSTFSFKHGSPLGIVGIMMDITKQQEQEEKLKILASIDSMTNLSNRRHFYDTSKPLFNLAKRNSKEIAIMMIDIDNFKNINDTYGHKVGDDIIIILAKKLLKMTRNSDIVARWGGEEFLILLPETNLDGAIKIAENIRNEVEKLVVIVEKNIKIKHTISIGISTVYEKDIDIDFSITRADKALYKAKVGGKNRVSVVNSTQI